jgi:hypothetical protein
VLQDQDDDLARLDPGLLQGLGKSCCAMDQTSKGNFTVGLPGLEEMDGRVIWNRLVGA